MTSPHTASAPRKPTWGQQPPTPTHTRIHIKLAAVTAPSIHGWKWDWNHIEQQPGHMWEWMSNNFRDFHAVVVPTPLELGVTINRNTCPYDPVFNEQTQKWSSSNSTGLLLGFPDRTIHHKRPCLTAGPVETDESSETIHFLLRGDGTIPQQDLAEVVIRANAAIPTATLTAVPTTHTEFDAAWRAATTNPGQERIIVAPPAKRCCICRLSEPACTCVAAEAARNPHAGPNAWITACAPSCPKPGLCRVIPNPFVHVRARHLVPLQPWRAPWTPSLG